MADDFAESVNTKEVVTLEDPTEGLIGISKRFAILNKLIGRDLNTDPALPVFYKYTKEDISKFLASPAKYEKQLRDAIHYIYGASPHFRRVIQYFVGLSDLSYVVEPFRIDPSKANKRTLNLNYRRVLNMLSSMNIKTQIPKILTVCLREDVFYGTLWVTNDNITIQQLPSDYCRISSIEGNVPNVTFDFSYFSSHQRMLGFYPREFQVKYDQYKKNRKLRWMELDAPTSFAIKCNSDILEYALPPFAGILREVFELEDYRDLRLEKTALDNYAMLMMDLPMDEDGNWAIDFNKAKRFWDNLSAVVPKSVGTILSPMDIKKISFERTHAGESNTITDAEENLFTAAGVSSLLFNNPKASAQALLLSIKADQCMTYGIVKSIGDAINRFIQAQSYGKNFLVNFLDVSPFNRKEVGDAYLKSASYGLPTISAYAASQGIGQAELDAMSYLEGTVLELPKLFKPITSSSQMSAEQTEEKLEGGGATDEGGAPQKDLADLTESGEQNREDA